MLLALLFAVKLASADELSFSPDCPGFADSTATVPAGRAQVELGVRSNFEDDGTLLTLPSVLLRIGLLEFLEVRATAPDVQVVLPKEGNTSAARADMGLGIKAAFSVGELFSASAVPFFSLPTGTQALSSRRVDAGIGLNFQLEVVTDLAIGWNAIFALSTVEDRESRVFDFGAGISIGYQFTESFGAFLESYIQYIDGSPVQPSIGGGLTYLVTPAFQLDLSGGAGLTSAAEGPYVLAGIAALL